MWGGRDQHHIKRPLLSKLPFFRDLAVWQGAGLSSANRGVISNSYEQRLWCLSEWQLMPKMQNAKYDIQWRPDVFGLKVAI